MYSLKKDNYETQTMYMCYTLLKNGKNTGVNIRYSKPAAAKKYMYRVDSWQSNLIECGIPEMRITFKNLYKAYSFAIHLSKYRFDGKKYPYIKFEKEK